MCARRMNRPCNLREQDLDRVEKERNAHYARLAMNSYLFWPEIVVGRGINIFDVDIMKSLCRLYSGSS